MPNLSRRDFTAAGSALFASGLVGPARLLAADTSASMSDADYVRAALVAIHPGLYRYQSPSEFAARHVAFAQAYNAGDFDAKVLALQELLGAVKCGHTYINPANQTKAIREKLYGERAMLPFNFRWVNGEMIVVSDPHGTGLAAGSRIMKINGVGSADILKRLLPFARADGSNLAKRLALMSVTGKERFGMFDLYYDLVFNPGAQVAVEAIAPGNEKRIGLFNTISYEQRMAAADTAVKADPAAPIWFSSRGNAGKTKIITMPTWAIYKTKWNWLGWLQGQLSEMLSDGTTGLVFDLRGNEGGQSIGEGMLPYFINEEISFPRPQELVRFREAPTELRPIFNTWDNSFYSMGKEAKQVQNGFFELKPARDQTLKPMEQTFQGKVAVLINADNSSATFTFAQQLRASGVATLIGEPTGGNQRGINGGAYFFTRLPESQLEFDIPLIGYFPEGDKPDAGLEPDVTLTQSPEDIAAGRDRAMAYALEVVA